MAPSVYFPPRRSLLLALHLVLFLFASGAHRLDASSGSSEAQVRGERLVRGFRGRMLLEMDELKEEEEEPVVPKKKVKPPIANNKSLSPKNQTKSAAKQPEDGLSLKNQTKLLKPNNGISPKNQTKTLLKLANSTKPKSSNLGGSELKKLNSTSSLKLKKLNSTSNAKSSNSTKGSSSFNKKNQLDLIKLASPKNKTAKSASSEEPEIKKSPKKAQPESEQVPKETKIPKPKPKQQPSWVDQDEDEDLASEFRDLPTRFQQTLIPDLERISTTSKAYLTKANKQMTKGFKPYVGNKYAPTIASVVSCVFILIPLLLVSLIFNRIKAYFSLQRLLIFVQIYLSIYFSILCLSSLTTGLEPLRFFYATSPSTYVCIQVMQTLGYVLYLLMLLMYLVLVFSTDCGLGPKFLGLAQTFVGYAVGLHYYVAVFHRMVLRQPPKTNWKVHGIYAVCFLLICLFAQAERRKKAYLEDGGEEGKKS
ncbi:uncharacterized protein LOC116208193 [Punica granatum]|uniref:Uncharacterized protein LOC116208193 n=2 Tax=Punica granatum TaxID=22663 RepID=A0A6P8DVW4_PUNGR|nr:uncharacterized protein LOC116208193 [Punica granatum]PKI58732.1 hypothetical protein CRG98_020888 [Punica granatum]